MLAVFYITGLAISAVLVSVLAATFSVSGLSRLFSGSAVAVILMGASLEFAKFMTAAFLHRVWAHLNLLYRTYLLLAVVVLSIITSMGIFGFLSDAYQSSSADLMAYNIKIDSLRAERQRIATEVARLNKEADEIPASRVTKKMEFRKTMEPALKELFQRDEVLATQGKDMDLKILEVKNKVGPLIYIARAFNQDLDTCVKWLIFVFVIVFDPLAICLVVATGEALRMRPLGYLDGRIAFLTAQPKTAPVQPVAHPKAAPIQPASFPLNEQAEQIVQKTATTEPMPQPEPAAVVEKSQAGPPSPEAEVPHGPFEPEEEPEIVDMRVASQTPPKVS